jgi:hypothetical protein
MPLCEGDCPAILKISTMNRTSPKLPCREAAQFNTALQATATAPSALTDK